MGRRFRRPQRTGAAVVVVAGLFILACNSSLIELPGGVGSGSDSDLPRVVFLGSAPPEALPQEEAAAWTWLQGHEDFDARLVQFIDLPRTTLPPDAVLWWHYANEEALPSIAARPANLRAVRNHLAGGGSLLLSLIAASYTVPLEIESSPPDIVSRRAAFVGADDEVGGFQSRGHPLLQRFWGGVLPSANVAYPPRPAVAYTGDRWPDEGRAWAVHKSEHGADPTTKIGIEYADVFGAGGTVLTLGAHCYFGDAGNRNRAQLEQLLVDALRYLDRQSPASPPGAPAAAVEGAQQPPVGGVDGARYWEPSTPRFVEVGIDLGTLPPAADAGIALNLVERSRSGIELTRYDDQAPFTLTSPRALLRGSQLGRIDEFRVHPQQLLSGLRFAIVRPDRGVTWLDTGAGSREFTARPEGAELYYNDGELEIRLHLAVDRRYPSLVGLMAVRSPAAVDIIATWRAHAGAEVPEGASPFGPPEIGWDDGAQAFVWHSADGFAVMGGFGRETPLHVLGFEPAIHLEDRGLVAPSEDSAVIGAGEPAGEGSPPVVEDVDSIDSDPASVALQVHIEPDRPALLPLVIVGGPAGELDVGQAFGELVAAPGRVWVDNARYSRDFLGRDTMGLLAPDPPFEDAFKWAKVGIDALRVSSPDMGAGIVSGFGAARSSEAWVATPNAFGGSGVLWATMAADAYGDRLLAADTLQMMARYQGVDGRIPDAIGPSGQLVENGVGATALFVIALDNHLRTWGDEALLDSLWPSVQRAIAYLFAADDNDDGLVNGASRLDRWSEDRGVQTPIDLAALWAAALQACQRMAVVVGDGDLAAQTDAAAARVRTLLNDAFWNPTARTFSFAKRSDGSFVPVSTVLPAVPMIFELLDPGNATAALDAFSSSSFSRDWGVGLVGVTAPPSEALGDAASALPPAPPTGSPSDAADLVSPVFTGWTALAEYANHRPVSGFAHALTNLLLLEHGGVGYATGAFDPVGFTPRTGIPHAAGAQAMTVLPVIWGALGIHPDAMNRSISIKPQLPADWDRVVVDRVRVGNSEFRLVIRRTSTQTQFVVDRWSGSRDIELRLTAHVPSDMAIALGPNTSGFEIVGEATVDEPTQRAFTTIVRPAPDAETGTLAVNHDPFPRLVAPTPLTARPFEAPGGLRVIRARYLGGMMSIEIEGLPGQEYALTLATPWNVSQVTGVPGARVVNAEEGTATVTVTIPGSGSRYRPIDLEVFFDR
jgi:hypothetical protein